MKDFRWGGEERRGVFCETVCVAGVWRFAWQCETGETSWFSDQSMATGVTEEGLAKGLELSIS